MSTRSQTMEGENRNYAVPMEGLIALGPHKSLVQTQGLLVVGMWEILLNWCVPKRLYLDTPHNGCYSCKGRQSVFSSTTNLLGTRLQLTSDPVNKYTEDQERTYTYPTCTSILIKLFRH